MVEALLQIAAAPEPLFKIDLGDNGGIFAPTTSLEVEQWIQTEQGFWSWANELNNGDHLQRIRQALTYLGEALDAISHYARSVFGNSAQASDWLRSVENYIKEALIERRLPHSTTPLAAHINQCRATVGDQAAGFMLAVYVPPDSGQSFRPGDLNAWRGFIQGLVEHFQINESSFEGRKIAADKAFELLRVKAETLIGEKKLVYDALHRDYQELATSIRDTSENLKLTLDDMTKAFNSAFELTMVNHKAEIDKLRQFYVEKMGLQAPVTYWKSKQRGHMWLARITGALSFVGIATTAIVLGVQAHDLLAGVDQGGAPEPWRIAVLVLMGLFGVWGMRLVVRMFLSNLHLETDAAERAVMVQTYLALVEGGQLTGAEDRQLILQALFRPASDGIVKDEGIPASVFEMLTRGPK